jgi:quercetin dioxygenase-like cupin family protein
MLCCDLLGLDVEPHHPQVLESAFGEGRVIAIDLRKGDQLHDHRTHERTYMIVVRGEIDVDAPDDGRGRGGPGTLFAFDPGESREVTATETARLVLILAPWPGEGHPGARDAT